VGALSFAAKHGIVIHSLVKPDETELGFNQKTKLRETQNPSRTSDCQQTLLLAVAQVSVCDEFVTKD
jgi:hypothetical protein